MKSAVALLALLTACKESRPIERFTASQGAETFDHARLDALLKKHVDDEGRVNYAQWKKSDVGELDEYLKAVKGAAPSKLTRDGQLAFWINVYNALTLRAILEFHPLKSIKDKVSSVGGYNVWDDYKITIEAKELSLNDIEHRVLRKMNEPRIHFALVCAAKGCPRLRNEAYSAEGLQKQFVSNMEHFFRQPRHFQLDRDAKVVKLSSLLKWYGGDFGATDKERLAAYSKALGEVERTFLQDNEVAVEFLDYDWNLNAKD